MKINLANHGCDLTLTLLQDNKRPSGRLTIHPDNLGRLDGGNRANDHDWLGDDHNKSIEYANREGGCIRPASTRSKAELVADRSNSIHLS